MTPDTYTEVFPDRDAYSTIYRSYDCAKCGLKIYQVAETAWTAAGKYYHEQCREDRRLL